MDAATESHGALDKLPYDIWTHVFSWLARGATTSQLLAARLVCRLFDSAIREERTAYQAVLSTQGHILRNNTGQVIKFHEGPASWWAVLMDQVRLDRTWIVGAPRVNAATPTAAGDGKADAPPTSLPGYEAIVLHHVPHDKYDVLLYYDWVCATVDPCDAREGEMLAPTASVSDSGAIGFFAHRKRLQMKRNNKNNKKQVRSMRYLAVHVLDYPSLQPIVTHTIFHRGFGWRTNLADLPRATDVNGNHVLSVDAPWIATLLLVDYKRQQYAMAYTDEYGVSALVLRSYGADAPPNGKTVGSFFFEGHCNGTFLRIVDDDTYRFYFSDNADSLYTHIHLLSRGNLAPKSEIIIPVATHFFDHFPDHNRELIMVASMHGEVSLWDVKTGQLQEWVQATPGHQLHVMFFRPLFRPGLLTESSRLRTTHALTPDPLAATPCPLHEQRPWTQLLIGWLNCLPGRQHLVQNTAGCLFNIACLPLDPRVSIDQLNAPPADRPPYRQIQSMRSLSMILGTPFLAGDITAHLLAVLQPDGRVVVIDLRASSRASNAPGAATDSSDSDSRAKPRVGWEPAPVTPLWSMGRATREYAAMNGETLSLAVPSTWEARARALGKTELKLVARRIHGIKLQEAARVIQPGRGATMSTAPHAASQPAQVIVTEDGVTDASEGEWEDAEEVTEIAPGQFVSVDDDTGSDWSDTSNESSSGSSSSEGESEWDSTTTSGHVYNGNDTDVTGMTTSSFSQSAATDSSSLAMWSEDNTSPLSSDAAHSSQWSDETESGQGNEEEGESDWSDSDGEEEEDNQGDWSQENAGDLMFLDPRGDAMLLYRGTSLVLLRRVQH